ncbi:unnamed protein product [Cuscuta epithymum]|uniref:Uncharacterized protein n=1 Tax=Cuscuta epithymum TaxID=186058 RepID=A0AAV0EWJ6_9ASTE|nr:unnamed protein product [Cuscuta epithymum]
MENSRRMQGGVDQWADVSRRPSQSKRPPRGPQGINWQQTVPSWEKAFCKTIGSLDWATILEMKKFAFLFDNVVKWDCSAGEVAFKNAKKRFWSESHGTQCDIPLPDPDLYIDEIDWDCMVDSDLLLDLECCRSVDPAPDKIHDPVIIFGDALVPGEAYTAPGWGEEEDQFHKDTNDFSWNNEDQWESGWMKSESRKESGWGNSGGWGLEVEGQSGWGGDWNADYPKDRGGWGRTDWKYNDEDPWESGWKKTENMKESGWGNSGEWGLEVEGQSGWGGDWTNSGDWNADYPKDSGGWGQPDWKYNHPKENFEYSQHKKWDTDKYGRLGGDSGNTWDSNYNQHRENYGEMKGQYGHHHNNFPGRKLGDDRSSSYRKRGNGGGRHKGKYNNSRFPPP